ncbi:hypothetical protein C6345_00175 [Bacillus sp. LNXM12-2]|nr:hypothetical protein [Bacillus pumilus]PRS36688.1 hypothetical protein C6Y02_14945 [Bacillus sp. NMCC4]PRS54142.1 hypothetical protein C6Y06_05135 [Bacillus sp. MZGC1]PRS73082.1 hypothetical protein C6Y03_15380 [Bacillus sp. LNXM65]PRS74391.1 hypothetical protein C6Y04_15725 [Bacillus sp. GBSW2]PSB69836.1 hypothetical protein C6Y07_14580 [Bacillus sp. LNXM12-1]PSB75780.1 hypothetical protein C6345_00175 [Bacillus sp. LNXM12-2]
MEISHPDNPSIHVGQIEYSHIEVDTSPQMLKGRLRLFQESLFFEYEDKVLEEVPAIKEWTDLLKDVPFLPILADIQKEQFIDSTNSVQDLSIFFSLKYFLPILTFDADRIEEPLSLAKHETGHIEWQDDAGLKGLFSHASKAQISQDTKNILQIILFPPSISREKSEALIQSLTKMFVQIHGGESKYELIEKAL